MPVSKRHVAYALALLVIVYLALQYHLHWNVSTAKLKEKSVVETKLNNAAYTAVKTFMEICHSHGFPVFIIEPRVLLSLAGNSSKNIVCSQHCPAWCRYLCTDHLVTTFGIIGHFWKLAERSLSVFHHNGFSLSVYNASAVSRSANNYYTIGGDSLPAHVLFSHNDGHIIHLVLFYERGDDERYLWHGRMVLETSSRQTNYVFSFDDGAYKRFDIAKVKLDDVRLRVPRHPLEFLSEMNASKFIECNWQRAKSFYAQYGQRETSSEAEQFYKAARDILVTVKHVLDSMNITFWISSGTCLGWFRQCDLIPYSKDVDIGIWIKDYNTNLIRKFQDNGLNLVHQFGKVSDSFELSFVGDFVKLDIFFFYEEEDYMWNGGTQARTGKKFKYIFPKFTLCWTEFLRLKIRVPCDTQSYVEANYGPNWFEPVKTWNWKESPPNVRPNGEWTVEERSAVVKQWSIS